MPPCRSGLKRARSEASKISKRSLFTRIVNEQEGLCWYCNEAMGVDCSREHLHSQAWGGTDTHPPDNLKAAHRDCNTAAGHLPVVDKMRLREIGHNEGRQAMLIIALQMRRADARLAFSQDRKLKPGEKPKPPGYWKRMGFRVRPDWFSE